MIRWQNATVTRIERRSKTISSFFFRLPQPFDFVAGQHANVRLTAPDGYAAQRSYSIVSAPEHGDEIEMAIERLDDGEVSPFFHDVVEVGDEIELRGPIGGHFVWRAGDGGPVLLIAAGSGVAPFVSMIRHRQAQASPVPMALLLSVRNLEDLPFGDELMGYADDGAGFDLTLTLTRQPDAPERFFKRRIDDAMVADVVARLPERPMRVFVCGSNAFVTTAVDAVLAAGVDPARVRTERYGV